MSDENRGHDHDAGVAESAGNTDIDLLVGAKSQAETPLFRFPDGFAVLMVDLMGTPEFFERFGGTAVLVLLQQHNELVVPIIHETGGTVVRSVGDTALVLYPDVREAARTSFHVVDRVAKYNASKSPDEQMQVRIGLTLATGSAEDASVFDAAVEEVADAAKRCPAGEIFATTGFCDAIDAVEGIKSRKSEGSGDELHVLTWTGEGAAPPITRQVISMTPLPAPAPETEAAAAETASSSKMLGRYEIQDEIGVGGMGVVYKAYDPTVGRVLAIKTVRLDAVGAERDEMVRRLRQEAQAVGRLEHPAVVTVYDAGEAKGVFYMAMQFVEGKVLGSYLTDRTLLPINQILTVMEEICAGVHYAHERGIVHRDLKPGNIILTPGGKPKVLDFGIAKLTETGNTRAGTILGTPNYMSPEQAAGRRVDRRTDVFSLGAILYELLTGERAFAGNSANAVLHKIREENPVSVRKIDPTIPPELESVVNRALAKDPFKRFQTAAEMQKLLAQGRAGKAAISRSAAADSTLVMSATPSAPSGMSPLNQPGAPVAPVVQRAKAPAISKPITPAPSRSSPPRKRAKSRWPVPMLLILLFVLALTSSAAVGAYQGWLAGSELLWVSNSDLVPLETLQKLPWIGKYFDVMPSGVQQAGVGGPAGGGGPAVALVSPGSAETETPPASPLADEQKPAEEIPPPPATGTAGDDGRRPNQNRRGQVRDKKADLSTEDRLRVDRWLRQTEQFLDRNQLPQADIALKRIFRVDPDNSTAKKLQERLRRIRRDRRN